MAITGYMGSMVGANGVTRYPEVPPTAGCFEERAELAIKAIYNSIGELEAQSRNNIDAWVSLRGRLLGEEPAIGVSCSENEVCRDVAPGLCEAILIDMDRIRARIDALLGISRAEAVVHARMREQLTIQTKE